MKKFIVAALVLLAPVLAQAQKFGHFDSQSIIPLMAEYKNATTELETLQKQYEEELKYMSDEYTKKLDDYEKQKETLPENIRQRREQELIESRQKADQYYQECGVNLQNKQTELMGKVNDTLTKSIEKVGQEGQYICIFDIATGAVPFVNSTLTTDVTEQVKAALGIK